MSRDGTNAGEGLGQHSSAGDTRRITTERLRQAGYDRSEARREAEKITRKIHEKSR